jgi:iron complex outermembrane receptor protein
MKNNYIKNNILRINISLALAGFMSFSVANAQDTSEKEDFMLEEVIVTAQKTEQNLQDVPMSVTAIDGDVLDEIRSGGSDIRFISGRVPSLIVESDFGRVFPRFYIRGLGNTDFDLNASQPVSLIYDDVVMENPMLKGFPVFDMDRVETLRGPQGTLFGRNTPAGIVKFDSVKPSDESSGYAKIGFGTFSQVSFEGAIGGALSEKWSARLSYLHDERDDWVKNEPGLVDPNLILTNGQENGDGDLESYNEDAYRLQFAYEGDDFNALFNIHGRDMEGTARVFRANIIQPGTNNFVPDYDRRRVSFDGGNAQTVESNGFVGKLEWDIDDDKTFTSITGYEEVKAYSRGDVDGGYGAIFLEPGIPSGPGFIPFPAQSADGIPDHHQLTQEFRFSKTSDSMFWQAGIFLFDEHLEVDTFNYDDLSPETSTFPTYDFFDNNRAHSGYAFQDQDTTAYAVFGQADFYLSDDTTLTAGLRWSHDSKDYTAGVPLAPFGAPPVSPQSVSTSDSNYSGNLSLSHVLNEDTNIYARIARGFRAPSIQGRVLFGGAITIADSETVTSFEAGFKKEMWDGRARLNTAVFYYQMSDQQLTAGSGTENVNQLVNADKTVGFGFESDLTAKLTENTLLTFGLSYNNTEIQDSDLTVTPCGSGCTVLDPAGSVPGTVSIDGNSLPRAPEWISNLVLKHIIPLNSGDIVLSTDWSYKSSYSFFLYESAEYQADAFAEGGLRIAYETDKWSAGLYGRNITDQDKLIAAIDFNNLEGIVNDPRIWGVDFQYNFF